MSPGKRVRVADVVRRRRTPRLDAVSLFALLIPLLTVGALALVRQPPEHDTTQPPALTRLTHATVVCPSASGASPDAVVSSAGGASGQVNVSSAGTTRPVQVRTGAAAALSGTGTQVVAGADALAPGLMALRWGTAPVTTQDCSVPAPEQWFTGVGARADHDSVIELVNPGAGPAVADITLYGTRPFSSRRLHGITIPGHKTVSIDLGKVVPRRPLLSAQVLVSRGRLAVHVLDSRTDLVTHRVRREWVPRESTPATDNLLLGLPTGTGSRTLQLANPGGDVVRAQVRVVTRDTSFVPAGLDTVSIPPGTTSTVPLTKVLDKALRDGAVGVEVRSDGLVTGSLLTSLTGDLALTVPDDQVRHEAATLLPVARGKGARPVTATVYLSADSAGAATVTAYDASGKQVLRKRVGQQQGRTVSIGLPRGSASVRVVPRSTVVRGSVVVSGDGASVIPLHELLTRGLVPQISPGLH